MSGRTQDWRHWCTSLVVGGVLIASLQEHVFAQITPDNTLPNNSIVTPDGNTLNITGGTQAGSNLFHSFGEFSVRNGGTAIFNNALDIQNIISRVTGRSVSDIDGIIRANGTANLFLINPNGIVFGQNAQLNVGGSFVASTANALEFGNRGFYSATEQNIPSELLTINPSALLFNQINQNAAIQSSSVAPAGTDPAGLNAFGLRVPDGKSLLLVGGNVSMDGGQLNAFGGRVELGGLAGEGIVELNGNGNLLNLDFPTVVPRADVSLSNNFLVDVRGSGGGSIIINAQNIDVRESSSFIAGIASGLRTASSRAGDITLNATGAIVIDSSLIGSDIREGSVGDGSNINIQAQSVTLNNGAALIGSTRGRGNGGRILIQATDRVSFDGTTSDSRFGSGAFSEVGFTGLGNAGDVNIVTGLLSVTNGAQIVASTRGRGNAGNINITTREQVSFNGTSSDGTFSSGAFSDVDVGAVGRGGNVNINTSSLSVTNGAQLVASTRGQGDAGDLVINTRTLLVQDGAQVSAATFGAGNGGSLTVNAQDDVQLIGGSANGKFNSGLFTSADPNSTGDAGDLVINTRTLLVRDGAQVSAATFGAGNGGSLTVNAQDDVQLIGGSANGKFNSGLLASAEISSTGDAGSLTIRTNTLLAKDGAQLTVSNRGTGNAGRISSEAFDIRLNNQGKITAASVSGRGGDIEIKRANLMLLRHNSLISATSGVAGSNGFDGNINIDTKFLIAVPSENSDIVATGFGRTPGSNIQVNAQGIFGTQFRQQLTSESDIVATGQVTLNTPDIDPNSGLVNLPVVPVDTQVAQTCTASSAVAKSSFTITGRGGLPPNPGDALNADAVQVDLVALNPSTREGKSPLVTIKPTTATPKPIVEATGWVINAKGELQLTANAPSTPHASWQNPVSCRAS